MHTPACRPPPSDLFLRSAGAAVEAQQPTKSLVVDDLVTVALLTRLDELVPEPLVVPLGVVVREVLTDRVTKVPLAEEDQPPQTFLLDRPHKTLGVGVRVTRVSTPRGWNLVVLPQRARDPVVVRVSARVRGAHDAPLTSTDGRKPTIRDVEGAAEDRGALPRALIVFPTADRGSIPARHVELPAAHGRDLTRRLVATTAADGGQNAAGDVADAEERAASTDRGHEPLGPVLSAGSHRRIVSRRPVEEPPRHGGVRSRARVVPRAHDPAEARVGVTVADDDIVRSGSVVPLRVAELVVSNDQVACTVRHGEQGIDAVRIDRVAVRGTQPVDDLDVDPGDTQGPHYASLAIGQIPDLHGAKDPRLLRTETALAMCVTPLRRRKPRRGEGEGTGNEENGLGMRDLHGGSSPMNFRPAGRDPPSSPIRLSKSRSRQGLQNYVRESGIRLPRCGSRKPHRAPSSHPPVAGCSPPGCGVPTT